MRAKDLISNAASVLALACALCGCASEKDIQTMRHPVLPPTSVVLADRNDELFRNIAIYEITGAPEFKFFDGGSVMTTRPTRPQVARMLKDWLYGADMLAGNERRPVNDVIHARYLLYVHFEDLHGPDVIFFTNKHADAKVRYTLKDMRTGEIVFDQTYESNFRARMPGVTQEMVRSAIVGGALGGLVTVHANNPHDETAGLSTIAAVGAVAGKDAGYFDAEHEGVLRDHESGGPWDDAVGNWPDITWDMVNHIKMGVVRGVVVGGLTAWSGYTTDGKLGNVKAATLGAVSGAAAGFSGAAPIGYPPAHFDSAEMIGTWGIADMGGTQRRAEAVRGMMLQNFDRFLLGLSEKGFVRVRAAEPCTQLNPDAEKFGYGTGVLLETKDAVGYDCPIDPHSRKRGDNSRLREGLPELQRF